ncbi:hypothetical protein CLI64_20460 [Nostoc sp. CENA543]|nr:hypothetical protein CLI64_20460 [Nostoc sp. CENA543]
MFFALFIPIWEMIATNEFLESSPVKHSKIQNGIRDFQKINDSIFEREYFDFSPCTLHPAPLPTTAIAYLEVP